MSELWHEFLRELRGRHRCFEVQGPRSDHMNESLPRVQYDHAHHEVVEQIRAVHHVGLDGVRHEGESRRIRQKGEHAMSPVEESVSHAWVELRLHQNEQVNGKCDRGYGEPSVEVD